MIEWGLIGVAVGSLLGLTGAGGAVIAIPLFMNVLKITVREATVFSLYAVVVGAGLNWIFQRKETQYITGLLLILFSFVGSLISKSIKSSSPDWLLSTFFLAVTLFSLWSLWRKGPVSQSTVKKSGSSRSFVKAALGGFFLGFVITMTGLGGGVILMPLLLGFLEVPMNQALPTSMLTITLSALISLAIQYDGISGRVEKPLMAALLLGALLSIFFVKYLIRFLSNTTINNLRRITITLVILGANVSVLTS
jgi:uncharacterized protein